VQIVVFAHPAWFGSASQQHFAHSLCQGLRLRGHAVQLRQPQSRLRAMLPRRASPPLLKWAGYVDQHLLFPLALRQQRARDPEGTLYVFSDQALGPWVAAFAALPHVVHCHDLLALASALGQGPGPRLGWTGQLYQRWIRRGFARARHFISVSAQTRDELLRLGQVRPQICAVVHNGLNAPFRRLAPDLAWAALQEAGLAKPALHGFLLHVGNGLWYKNTAGVLAIYARYCADSAAAGNTPLPLWMRCPAPDTALQAAINALPPTGHVRFLPALTPQAIAALYSVAELLLFPSHAEGFGWPIAEAMACGCAVVTTGAPPMTELAGRHALYLPVCPPGSPADAQAEWAAQGAGQVQGLLARGLQQRAADAATLVDWARRFEPMRAIDGYLDIYRQILNPGAAMAPAAQTS